MEGGRGGKSATLFSPPHRSDRSHSCTVRPCSYQSSCLCSSQTDNLWSKSCQDTLYLHGSSYLPPASQAHEYAFFSYFNVGISFYISIWLLRLLRCNYPNNLLALIRAVTCNMLLPARGSLLSASCSVTPLLQVIVALRRSVAPLCSPFTPE